MTRSALSGGDNSRGLSHHFSLFGSLAIMHLFTACSGGPSGERSTSAPKGSPGGGFIVVSASVSPSVSVAVPVPVLPSGSALPMPTPLSSSAGGAKSGCSRRFSRYPNEDTVFDWQPTRAADKPDDHILLYLEKEGESPWKFTRMQVWLTDIGELFVRNWAVPPTGLNRAKPAQPVCRLEPDVVVDVQKRLLRPVTLLPKKTGGPTQIDNPLVVANYFGLPSDMTRAMQSFRQETCFDSSSLTAPRPTKVRVNAKISYQNDSQWHHLELGPPGMPYLYLIDDLISPLKICPEFRKSDAHAFDGALD